MPVILWDASGLAKRYAVEIGSAATDALFESLPKPDMISTMMGYAETYSLLLRKLNDGRLDVATFTIVSSALQDEVLDDPDFGLLTIDDTAILAGLSLMKSHHINATDAAVLATCLRYVRALDSGDPPCLFVAADHRFLRAADAEGLKTLNPEAIAAADVPAFLASL